MFVCKIITENQDDYNYLRENLGKYPVKIIQSNIIDCDNIEVPIMLIGWNFVKKIFPNQNILDEEITNNIKWGFSITEKKDDYNNVIEKFINFSVKKWLPKEFVLYDSIINNQDFFDFILETINKEKKSYLYFNKGALYVYNDNKNIIINIKSMNQVYKDELKEMLTKMINEINCMCFSYKNISDYVNMDKLKCIFTFENAMWVKYFKEINKSYFNILPDFDINKYIPFIMSKISFFTFNEEEKIFMRRMCVKDNITQWLCDRTINLSNNFNKDILKLTIINKSRFIKVNYSSKRAITGRILANDWFNPQNLEKKNSDREVIVSRFKGGKILVFDYISYEARIALYLSEDNDFIEKNKDKDLHLMTASIIFGEKTFFSNEERSFSKTINHQMLFGASKSSVIKNLSFIENPEEVYSKIYSHLYPIIKKSIKLFDFNKKNGYIINDWGTIIKPEKDYASFNNYIQSSAVEIIVDQLYKIKNFIKDYKTQFMFQVFDSLVFDIHPDEFFLIDELKKIIENYNGMVFHTSCNMGDNYKNLVQQI